MVFKFILQNPFNGFILLFQPLCLLLSGFGWSGAPKNLFIQNFPPFPLSLSLLDLAFAGHINVDELLLTLVQRSEELSFEDALVVDDGADLDEAEHN